MKGILTTLVKSVQSDSARRVGTPVQLAECSAVSQSAPISMVGSSNDVPIYEINGMKGLLARTVFAKCIMHHIATEPHNLVINNVKNSEREKKRVLRVVEYMTSFATKDEKLVLNIRQPARNDATWTQWFSRIGDLSKDLQERAMSALLLAEQATMTAEEIKNSKHRDPYVSAMDSRIGLYVDVTGFEVKKRARVDVGVNAVAGYNKLFGVATSSSSMAASSSSSAASSSFPASTPPSAESHFV